MEITISYINSNINVISNRNIKIDSYNDNKNNINSNTNNSNKNNDDTKNITLYQSVDQTSLYSIYHSSRSSTSLAYYLSRVWKFRKKLKMLDVLLQNGSFDEQCHNIKSFSYLQNYRVTYNNRGSKSTAVI